MFGDTIPFSYIILSARILGGKFAPPPPTTHPSLKSYI